MYTLADSGCSGRPLARALGSQGIIVQVRPSDLLRRQRPALIITSQVSSVLSSGFGWPLSLRSSSPQGFGLGPRLLA